MKIILIFCLCFISSITGYSIEKKVEDNLCTLFITCDVESSFRRLEKYGESYCNNDSLICGLSQEFIQMFKSLFEARILPGLDINDPWGQTGWAGLLLLFAPIWIPIVIIGVGVSIFLNVFIPPFLP